MAKQLTTAGLTRYWIETHPSSGSGLQSLGTHTMSRRVESVVFRLAMLSGAYLLATQIRKRS